MKSVIISEKGGVGMEEMLFIPIAEKEDEKRTSVEVHIDGVKVSRTGMIERKSMFCGTPVDTVLFGGVETQPQYRRYGLVRKTFDACFALAEEKNWAVSFLHPFSFGYYRKFGYEKVADQLILEFPVSKIDFTERCTDFVPLKSEEQISDVLSVYAAFAKNRNGSFVRLDASQYCLEPNLKKMATYIRYRDGKPVAYVSLSTEKELYINRMNGLYVHVHEMAFTDRDALLDIFGFLRLFEGETEKVQIHNAAMMPEVDMLLRHYHHTAYNPVPDFMARILHTEKMLLANIYPMEKGYFSLRVEDSLPSCRGCFSVEYENGKAEVKRLPETADCDAVCTVGALTQLLYGYYALTPGLLPYCNGVTVHRRAEDFCRAFPKRYCGIFEHF